MPFNSLKYFLFLSILYPLFFVVGKQWRWVLLLAASLLFYASLKVPFLIIILLMVAGTTYAVGIRLDAAATPRARRMLFWSGVTANLVILVSMKYLPFLAENLRQMSTLLSLDLQIQHVKAVAAIGVSYYVFQAISYLSDVYLELEKPEPHFGHFLLYLAFFPKLQQGPIERAGHLIPQLKVLEISSVTHFRTGILLIAGGLFKKVIIADRLSLFVDPVYSNVYDYAGIDLVFATYAYAFQIYFDFSGYTDIALGTAQLFNIDLTRNFNSPYTATSVAEFWRRWHISFSRWILDYVFKPLQMQWRNHGNCGTAVALVVAFLVSGIWHGANWGFIVWGGLHGLYLGCSVFYKPYQKKLHKALKLEKTGLLKIWQMFITFHLVCFSWIFFRANTLGDAWYIVTHALPRGMESRNFVEKFEVLRQNGPVFNELKVLLLSLLVLAVAASVAKREKMYDAFFDRPLLRSCFYYSFTLYLLIFWYSSNQSFAYVKF